MSRERGIPERSADMPRKPLIVGEWCRTLTRCERQRSCRAGEAGQEHCGASLRLTLLFEQRPLLCIIGVDIMTEGNSSIFRAGESSRMLERLPS